MFYVNDNVFIVFHALFLMKIGPAFFTIGILVVVILAFSEFKKWKHKIVAVLLIILVLFTYFSFNASLKGKDVSLNSVNGIMSAGKLYFAWLGTAFNNVKSITAYAVKKNWSKYNSSSNSSNSPTNSTNISSLSDEIWSKL